MKEFNKEGIYLKHIRWHEHNLDADNASCGTRETCLVDESLDGTFTVYKSVPKTSYKYDVRMFFNKQREQFISNLRKELEKCTGLKWYLSVCDRFIRQVYSLFSV